MPGGGKGKGKKRGGGGGGGRGGAKSKSKDSGGEQKVMGQSMSFWRGVYRCKACGVDSSGEAAFAQHCAGGAHASVGGYRGVAGLAANAAGIRPPFSDSLTSR